MKQSNTKLTSVEKQLLCEFKSNMPDNMAFATYGNLTVLVQRMGLRTIRIATSVASCNEKKIRTKVGEYLCMERLTELNQYVTLPTMPYMQDGYSAKEIAEYLAYDLSY